MITRQDQKCGYSYSNTHFLHVGDDIQILTRSCKEIHTLLLKT